MGGLLHFRSPIHFLFLKINSKKVRVLCHALEEGLNSVQVKRE